MAKRKEFKFHYRKGGAGVKILVFNTNQITKYLPEVRNDFIALVLTQLKRTGVNVKLDWDIQLLQEKWATEYRCVQTTKTIKELHLYRALTDYCSSHVNISFLDNYELICELLEDFYIEYKRIE